MIPLDIFIWIFIQWVGVNSCNISIASEFFLHLSLTVLWYIFIIYRQVGHTLVVQVSGDYLDVFATHLIWWCKVFELYTKLSIILDIFTQYIYIGVYLANIYILTRFLGYSWLPGILFLPLWIPFIGPSGLGFHISGWLFSVDPGSVDCFSFLAPVQVHFSTWLCNWLSKTNF